MKTKNDLVVLAFSSWVICVLTLIFGWFFDPFVRFENISPGILRWTTQASVVCGWACFMVAGISLVAAIWFTVRASRAAEPQEVEADFSDADGNRSHQNPEDYWKN